MSRETGFVGGNLLPNFTPKTDAPPVPETPVEEVGTLPAEEIEAGKKKIHQEPAQRPEPPMDERPQPTSPAEQPPKEPLNYDFVQEFGFDKDTIKANLQRAKELEETVTSLKSKVVDNPLLLKLKEEIDGGANHEKLSRLIKVSMLDVDKLSDLEAITEKILLESPNLTAEQVKAFVQKNYLVEDGYESETIDEVKASIEGARAKEWLNSQKVSFEQVKQPDLTPIREGFATIGETIVKGLQTIKVEIPNVDNLGDYTYEYPLQIEESERKEIVSQLVNVAINAGLQLNEQSAKQLALVAEKLVENSRAKEIHKRLVQDVAAKTAAAIKRANAGDPRPPAGTVPYASPKPKAERPRGYF